jgi:hypothetical protein
MRQETIPEVLLLEDGRGERPQNAVGVGSFWYDPEVWNLPLSPAARVLYSGLCSFVANGRINRRDLRNTLESCTDEEIASAFEELTRCGLIQPLGDTPGHRILPARQEGA